MLSTKRLFECAIAVTSSMADVLPAVKDRVVHFPSTKSFQKFALLISCLLSSRALSVPSSSPVACFKFYLETEGQFRANCMPWNPKTISLRSFSYGVVPEKCPGNQEFREVKVINGMQWIIRVVPDVRCKQLIGLFCCSNKI